MNFTPIFSTCVLPIIGFNIYSHPLNFEYIPESISLACVCTPIKFLLVCICALNISCLCVCVYMCVNVFAFDWYKSVNQKQSLSFAQALQTTIYHFIGFFNTQRLAMNIDTNIYAYIHTLCKGIYIAWIYLI